MIDCHVHIFDPARFPYAPDTWYTPAGSETGTAAQLIQVMDAHGVRHALLVGPNSGYGLDNRCMLDAIRHSGGRFKGVAVVRVDASRAELQDLQAQGVVGVTMNVALLGVDFYRNTAPLLARLRDLGLWAQVQVRGDQLVDLKPMLVGAAARTYCLTTVAALTRWLASGRRVLRRYWRWQTPAGPVSSCPAW